MVTEPDPNAPAQDFFDVHEAYWSPIDKGKTTPKSVLQWLLTTVFLPINDTARYYERRSKVAWDVGFLLCAMLLGVACFALFLLAAAWALGATRLENGNAWSVPDALGVLAQPLKFIAGLDLGTIALLVVGLVGAYLAAQVIRAIWSLLHNLRYLSASDPLQLSSRLFAIGVLVVLAAAGILTCMFVPTHGHQLRVPGIILVVAVFAFQSGQALLLWFITNFFGDVQIYTTRDENSEFFALREQILALVTQTIISVASDSPSGQPYDRVHILAHSLGTTISMDALLRIYNAQKAGSVDESAWQRIRSFVTFGTSLEKTKYFFNAWSPTQSQAFEEWQDDLYGPIFTADPAALTPASQTHGVYWLNRWYFSDFVADQIGSYRSFVLPDEPPSTRSANREAALKHAKTDGVAVAGRLVAANCCRFGDFNPLRLHFVTHGDYLGDQVWFWQGVAANRNCPGVIDVLTASLSWASPNLPKRFKSSPSTQLPYESKPLSDAGEFYTRDVLK